MKIWNRDQRRLGLFGFILLVIILSIVAGCSDSIGAIRWIRPAFVRGCC
jgi:hypothetical protein